MKIYRKEGDVVQLISFPEESVEKGDYLLIEDQTSKRGMVVQIIDIQYANIPGILEDILRDVMTEESVEGSDYDPLDVSSQITVLKDTKLLICKIRGSLEDGTLSHSVAWLPSRTNSRISHFPVEAVMNSRVQRRPIPVGHTKAKSDLVVDARCFDGGLNIITGKKGTGKSHLSKLLVLGLIEHGAPCLVLDVNGEYVNLDRTRDGKTTQYTGRIEVLTPRANLRFALSEVGLGTILSIMLYALDLPGTSARVFAQIWRELEHSGRLDLRTLGEAISNWDCHESVREALQSRYNTIVDSGIFTDDPERALRPQALINRLKPGGALIVNMRDQFSSVRRMIVELLIHKLTELLSSMKLRAMFLFAEEAHLYLRETYWDDIVTRMRHLGVFTTFITNQPDTLQESIYRQADNVFLFNFTNEHDLEAVSRASKVDAESVKLLVKDLPPHYCLAIGELVHNFPLVVNVRSLDVETLGGTRYFFED